MDTFHNTLKVELLKINNAKYVNPEHYGEQVGQSHSCIYGLAVCSNKASLVSLEGLGCYLHL